MSATPVLTLEDAHTGGFELVKEHAARFGAYVTALDPAAVAVGVPGSDWTVGETIAHVQSVFLRYTVDHRRVDNPDELAARNADDVAALGVDVDVAAASIRDQVELLGEALPQIAPDQQFPFHGGLMVTLAAGWGNALGELLAHGDDIARATGSPFGIPSDDLEILWRFTGPALAGWVRPEAAVHRDVWRLVFPFGPITIGFDSGALSWGVPDVTDPDHVLEVHDAAEFALTFPYRRRPIADPATAILAARFYDL